MASPADHDLARRSKATLEALRKISKGLPQGAQTISHDGGVADQTRRRRRAARAADASLRIEGLHISDEARVLKDRYCAGKLSAEAWLERLKARHQSQGHG